MKKIISYSDAQISKKDTALVAQAMRNGWGRNNNKYVNLFEKKFAKKLNVKYALATSSCTGAMHIAIAALDLPKGSEVIMADSNWIATLSPVIHLGLKPVFVDVKLDNWCIDPDKIKKKINKKTSLIIATHLYGNACEIKMINRIAKKNGIPVLEDSAEALGSKIDNKLCGTLSDIGCFSFHGSKTLTTGEGGMIVTNKKNIYEKCKTLNNHGRTAKEYKLFTASYIGFKYKMTNLQAAVGLSQLKELDKKILKKREIFKNYKRNLSDIKIKMNNEKKKEYNSYWMTNIVFDEKYKINVKKLINYLEKRNIQARPFFPPLSQMKFFKLKKFNKNANLLHKNSINLPSSLNLGQNDILYVCNSIKEYLRKIK